MKISGVVVYEGETFIESIKQKGCGFIEGGINLTGKTKINNKGDE